MLFCLALSDLQVGVWTFVDIDFQVPDFGVFVSGFVPSGVWFDWRYFLGY